MALLFVLVLSACSALLWMHHLASRVPRGAAVLGNVPVAHIVSSESDRLVVQVERSAIDQSAGPLREALRDAETLTIGPCRYTRASRGVYYFRGWSATASLKLTATDDARILNVSYQVQTRW